jgi:hypothetical protein
VGKPEGKETRPTCTLNNKKKDLKNNMAMHGLDWAGLRKGTYAGPDEHGKMLGISWLAEELLL